MNNFRTHFFRFHYELGVFCWSIFPFYYSNFVISQTLLFIVISLADGLYFWADHPTPMSLLVPFTTSTSYILKFQQPNKQTPFTILFFIFSWLNNNVSLWALLLDLRLGYVGQKKKIKWIWTTFLNHLLFLWWFCNVPPIFFCNVPH